MDARAIVEDLYRSIDAMDAEAFSGFLTEGASFRFANADPVVGKDNVREAVGGFFSMIAGLSHRLDNVWAQGDDLISNGQFTYRRHDGSELSVPFATIFKLEDGKIAEYLIYVDASAL